MGTSTGIVFCRTLVAGSQIRTVASTLGWPEHVLRNRSGPARDRRPADQAGSLRPPVEPMPAATVERLPTGGSWALGAEVGQLVSGSVAAG